MKKREKEIQRDIDRILKHEEEISKDQNKNPITFAYEEREKRKFS